MGFIKTHDPGRLGARLISDYADVEQVLSHFVPQIIGSFVLPIVLLVILFFQNWKLALITALVFPAAVPFSMISHYIITRLGKKHQKIKTDASSRMLEYVQGIRLIKAFGLSGEKFEQLCLVGPGCNRCAG